MLCTPAAPVTCLPAAAYSNLPPLPERASPRPQQRPHSRQYYDDEPQYRRQFYDNEPRQCDDEPRYGRQYANEEPSYERFQPDDEPRYAPVPVPPQHSAISSYAAPQSPPRYYQPPSPTLSSSTSSTSSQDSLSSRGSATTVSSISSVGSAKSHKTTRSKKSHKSYTTQAPPASPWQDTSSPLQHPGFQKRNANHPLPALPLSPPRSPPREHSEFEYERQDDSPLGTTALGSAFVQCGIEEMKIYAAAAISQAGRVVPGRNTCVIVVPQDRGQNSGRIQFALTRCGVKYRRLKLPPSDPGAQIEIVQGFNRLRPYIWSNVKKKFKYVLDAQD